MSSLMQSLADLLAGGGIGMWGSPVLRSLGRRNYLPLSPRLLGLRNKQHALPVRPALTYAHKTHLAPALCLTSSSATLSLIQPMQSHWPPCFVLLCLCTCALPCCTPPRNVHPPPSWPTPSFTLSVFPEAPSSSLCDLAAILYPFIPISSFYCFSIVVKPVDITISFVYVFVCLPIRMQFCPLLYPPGIEQTDINAW
jgi:hypothetical protein